MYEFICGDCESDFEKLVASAAAASSVECPSCGSKKVHKKLSVFAKSSAGASPSGYSSGFSGGGHCCGGSCSCH